MLRSRKSLATVIGGLKGALAVVCLTALSFGAAAQCFYDRAIGSYVMISEARDSSGYLSGNLATWYYKGLPIAQHNFWYQSVSTVPVSKQVSGFTVSRSTYMATEAYPGGTLAMTGTNKFYSICINGFTAATANAATYWNDPDNTYNPNTNEVIVGGQIKGTMHDVSGQFGMIKKVLLKNGFESPRVSWRPQLLRR